MFDTIVVRISEYVWYYCCWNFRMCLILLLLEFQNVFDSIVVGIL